MITETILDVIFGFIDGIFSLLPVMEWSVDTSAWQYAKDFLDMICYLLPYDHICAIAIIIIDLTIIRIVIAFIKTIWDLLPLV